MDSSSVLLAAASAAAERLRASPTPDESIANLLPTSLNLSTINIALSDSMPKAFIVEIIDWDAVPMSSIPSPTFLYTIAASASLVASPMPYPSLEKSATALIVSEIVPPTESATLFAVLPKLSYWDSVNSVTFLSSVIAESMSLTFS